MGCCWSNRDTGKTVEMSQTTNDCVSCKCGMVGKNITSLLLDNKNFALEGTGIALGSCPLDCDTAYFEVRVGKNPIGMEVGVKRFNPKKPSSLAGGLDEENATSPSWTLKEHAFKEGDCIGVYWDQTDLPMLSFSVNGVMIPSAAVSRVKPSSDVYPAVSLQNGSCEVVYNQENFKHAPTSNKFKMIVCATSLI